MSNITMSNINGWIQKFIKSWEAQDIVGVMSLFTEDVEYWETPFTRIVNKTILEHVWNIIKEQKDIIISCEVFSKENDTYTVLWDLEYFDKNSQKKTWKGIYLIRLNSENLCDYFLQCGEECNNC